MKKNILLLLTILLGLSSCYKDDSAVNYRMINPIRIDAGMDAKYRVFALDTLQISPIVYKEGIDDDDLEFYWEISGNLIVPTKIGDKMSLKMEMNFAPESTSYKLLYRVTDKTTGIYIEKVVEVEIQSPFGSGLLVCDSEDGVQSDISLVMARNFDGLIENGADTVISKLFSRMNNRKVDGIIMATHSMVAGTDRSLTIATMNSIERVDPYDFNYMDGNSQAFHIDPGVYKVNEIAYVNSSGIELIVNDGKVHQRIARDGKLLFSYHLMPNSMADYRVSQMVCGAHIRPLAFDELGGRVIAFSTQYDAIVTLESVENASTKFKPTQLQGFTCLEAFTGEGTNKLRDYHMILEDKITKRRYSYVLNASNSNTTHGTAKRIIDFDPAKCPDIDEAIAFDAAENQKVIYYATKNKIYSVGYPTETDINVSEEYTVPEGEEITGILMWKKFQIGGKVEHANPDTEAEEKITEVSAINRMIVIASYNPITKEGIVRTVAIKYIGSGQLEQSREFHNEYKGFAKISNMSAHQR